ncbi:baseplate assembly protein [Parasaccharibacter sp. TMW2.1882]|uniref:Baseplate assembly protein n=1 Tax=Parasaccharibacter apium TaxID=1510841 RepID=A0A7U7J017_9PROT|nr:MULTISPECIES: Gp138 family membrane-puncturing spike protein [Acetobacteraceae]MCL1563005.1 baseplate assembly protein [Parasaccharibacter sp. TMW 2.1886]MCQ0042355.1 baseplate assembly protein [Bombella sp.]MUG78895.1 baseplate assembly protein [Bombella sp. ESL0380]MUH02213.1 baseplate assembly protein [Bombella sp. ESL0387]MCK8636205.1 baseplate assembly protein [Parasaccharibacter sp. TMW2.1885]
MPATATPYLLRSNAGKNSLKGALDSLIASHINQIGPSMLVQVETVTTEAAAITGKVTVRPMVQQQDALSRTLPHDLIHNVPYLRLQGGRSAFIIDPKPGDIGFIIISGRDHTHAITTRQPSPPASFRQFSMQDCVYVGGFLNEGPDQFIQATDQGWRIVTPGSVTIDAQGPLTLKASRIEATCDIVTSGDVQAGGISLKQHTHGGVQTGPGTSAPPQ